MAAIVWAGTFTDGNQLLGAELEATKDAITDQVNGALDDTNIAAGGIGTSSLAAPRAYYTITVPLNAHTDALSSTVLATAQPGIRLNQNPIAFFFQVPVASTIVGLSITCGTSTQAGGTRANTARIFVDSTGVDSALTFSSGAVVDSAAFSQVVTPTSDLEIRCTTDTAATDGVTRPVAYVHCTALHVA